jgi:hypothetical protein
MTSPRLLLVVAIALCSWSVDAAMRKVQRYVCLRTPPALEALAASKSKRGGTRYEFATASGLETMHEQHVLKALVGLRGQCYTWDGGYWKYELCPMRQLRQLHYEGKSIAAEIALGDYQLEADQFVKDPVSGHFFYRQTYKTPDGERVAEVRGSLPACAPFDGGAAAPCPHWLVSSCVFYLSPCLI